MGAVEIDAMTLPTTRTFEGAVSRSAVPLKMRTFSNRTAAGCTPCAYASAVAAYSKLPSAAARLLELRLISFPLLVFGARRGR